jgi:hypothetical protein
LTLLLCWELKELLGLEGVVHFLIHLKAVDEDSGAGMEDALCWFAS